MIKHLITIIGLFLVFQAASGQSRHYFHCLKVSGGDSPGVRLDWEAVGSEDEFICYRIYRSIPPSGFVRIDSIFDFSLTEYTDTVPEVRNMPVKYFLVTELNTPEFVSSDTLATMYLTVGLDNPDPVVALLQWSRMHDPDLAVWSGYDYRLMSRSYLNPLFTGVYAGTDTSFLYPIDICNDSIVFRVERDNDYGCTSISNTASKRFVDISPPPPTPKMESVSINPFTGEVYVSWKPSSNPKVDKYYVYHIFPDLNDILDTVYGINNTFYTDSVDACNKTWAYGVAAEDSCNKVSPGTYDSTQFHRTILLKEVDFDPCRLENSLEWTEYINMNPPLEGYRVYLSLDTAAFELLATVPADSLAFLHEGLEPGRRYRYFIRAFSQGSTVTSTSCIRELTTWQYLRPIENHMDNASVIASESVFLTLLPDTFASVPRMNIYRSGVESGPWQLIDSLALSGQDTVYYEDEAAEVNQQSYYYYTSLIDSCENEVLATEHMRTIFLQGERDGQVNNLAWNAFEGWQDGVLAYEILRAVNDDGSFQSAGFNLPGQLEYADDISSLGGGFSMLRYLVRALREGDTLFSYSNEVIFEYTPDIFLPNAFKPGGVNPVFRPVGVFADFAEYQMDIYNRWGELLFSSKDFGLGWDGKHDGKDVPAGVYVCVLTYRSAQGESRTLKTTFLLLR
jgi:gliding motility-associated-like protein